MSTAQAGESFRRESFVLRRFSDSRWGETSVSLDAEREVAMPGVEVPGRKLPGPFRKVITA